MFGGIYPTLWGRNRARYGQLWFPPVAEIWSRTQAALANWLMLQQLKLRPLTSRFRIRQEFFTLLTTKLASLSLGRLNKNSCITVFREVSGMFHSINSILNKTSHRHSHQQTHYSTHLDSHQQRN